MTIPLTYKGPFPEVTIDPGHGAPAQTVKRGQSVELPKQVAEALLAQDPLSWDQRQPQQPKPKKG